MQRISQAPPSSAADRVEACVLALQKRLGRGAEAPKIGLVLGSGLGSFAEGLENRIAIPYSELPHMAVSAVHGHAGNMCFGRSGGIDVVCMQGRVHLYEGHPVEKVVQGVRTMAGLGVRFVLLTNAAGGIEPSWSAGDLMTVTDHLNLTGASPLVGPHDESLGPRFPDMTDAYDPALRAFLHEAARSAGFALREGVYAGLLGPQYETPAEIRMLRSVGAHAVGMSTVHEVIALRALGVRLAALSCITNLAAGLSRRKLSHDEVQATAEGQRASLQAVVTGWIERAAALATGPSA